MLCLLISSKFLITIVNINFPEAGEKVKVKEWIMCVNVVFPNYRKFHIEVKASFNVVVDSVQTRSLNKMLFLLFIKYAISDII